MGKNVAIFSADGTSVEITFGKDGDKKTISYSSKKDAFEAITDLASKKELTPEEFRTMRDQILAKGELEWSNSPEIEMEVMLIPSFFGTLLFGGLLDNLTDSEPVEQTTLRMCGCGKHGHFQTTKGRGPMFKTQSEALKCIDAGIEQKHILLEEKERLLEEIKNCSLPVGEKIKEEAATAN